MIKKISLFTILLFTSLSANNYKYHAEIGCKRVINWSSCIDSIKLNGRIEPVYKLLQKYQPNFQAFRVGLPEHFDLTVTPSRGVSRYMIYNVKILNNAGKEVFYEEKDSKYSVIKVGN